MGSVFLGIAVLAIVLVAWLIAGRARPARGFERIVRCRAGHVFTTTLVPGMSFKSVRLGNVRFERCPVGRHWAIVRAVDESTLSHDEIALARAHHDVRIP